MSNQNQGYGFKYPLKYAFGSYVYSVNQVNRLRSLISILAVDHFSTVPIRNYADPLLAFSSSVGEKDYSDRLIFKVFIIGIKCSI